ncbi:MAG: hypothetical protein A4E35_02264 [Methanoregula sp. PtaU1.Bin051]|nr:MAG: hypothetical protein A4E35_02264 [Methanoregula sp. PtaU1.Bin051]
MTHPPRITDESVLARWMGLEIAKMNDGLVVQRKPLSLLLCEVKPSSVTRKGEVYFFDINVIQILGKSLPEELQRQLKLPILFYLSPDVPDSCSCPDAPTLAALQILNEMSTLRTMEGGRFWVSRPIAYAIMGKYPTAVQIVMGA